ncbi:hypothetical protein CEXT_699631 [Caerostris extrusa]|uniref:Uncharacterized protein n=1 Tax=Caerostris extrusa TaxID=172846 RepID=A0AAV4TBR9_CAEEX|nr:hypothetical protein CEXT_699631 [Caerostris extrusa]
MRAILLERQRNARNVGGLGRMHGNWDLVYCPSLISSVLLPGEFCTVARRARRNARNVGGLGRMHGNWDLVYCPALISSVLLPERCIPIAERDTVSGLLSIKTAPANVPLNYESWSAWLLLKQKWSLFLGKKLELGHSEMRAILLQRKGGTRGMLEAWDKCKKIGI